MNFRLTFAALVSLIALLAIRTTATAADAYTIDPAHTSVVFSVSHSGFSYTYGMFRKVEGNYIFDGANPANCQFRFAIQTDSVDTNHAERDTHLKSPDFFNAQQFPTISFASTSVERAHTRDGSVVYNVTGDLTMHGVTKRVTFPLRMLGEGVGPFQDYRTGFLTNLTLKRSDFGMSNLLENNMVGDAVAITISFEGSRQQAAGTQPRTQ
ncbi:MAG: YceI family protein [Pirellulales bacterium]